jgi:hypothetical protein
MRSLFVALAFTAILYGEDIAIPLQDGNLILANPTFIRVNDRGTFVPELVVQMKNETSFPWRTIKLEFDIGGLCNGEPRQWTVAAVTSLGWLKEQPVIKEYKDYMIPLVGKVDGCKTEVFKARLIYAEYQNTRVNGKRTNPYDLQAELLTIKAKHEADAVAAAEAQERADAAQAERNRLAAIEEQKQRAEDEKKAAEEFARKKRTAAAQKKKQDEQNAKLVKIVEDLAAREAEERRKARETCAAVYKATANKKIADVTVKEAQQIQSCQALGLYQQ